MGMYIFKGINMQNLPSINTLLKNDLGTSLVVQWVRLRAANVGGPDSIPACLPQLRSLRATTERSHMLQLKILHAIMKIWHAATKTWCSLNK